MKIYIQTLFLCISAILSSNCHSEELIVTILNKNNRNFYGLKCSIFAELNGFTSVFGAGTIERTKIDEFSISIDKQTIHEEIVTPFELPKNANASVVISLVMRGEAEYLWKPSQINVWELGKFYKKDFLEEFIFKGEKKEISLESGANGDITVNDKKELWHESPNKTFSINTNSNGNNKE